MLWLLGKGVVPDAVTYTNSPVSSPTRSHIFPQYLLSYFLSDQPWFSSLTFSPMPKKNKNKNRKTKKAFCHITPPEVWLVNMSGPLLNATHQPCTCSHGGELEVGGRGLQMWVFCVGQDGCTFATKGGWAFILTSVTHRHKQGPPHRGP